MDECRLTLVSSEGEPFVFSLELLQLSEWLDNLVDDCASVNLYDLGVDSETLRLLQSLLDTLEYFVPECPKQLREESFARAVGRNGRELEQFFRVIGQERLLKLCVAMNKLGLARLTSLCCLYIAALVKDFSKENFCEALGLGEKTSWEELDVWADARFPWLQDEKLKLLDDEDDEKAEVGGD